MEEIEYKKDFDKWNIEKQKIDDNLENEEEEKFFFYPREVWWTSVGVNVGKEIDGKNQNFERPILVIKRINKFQFFGIPLSNQEKKGYFYIKVQYSNTEKINFANIAQFKVFSVRRLLRKVTTIEEEDFLKVKKKLQKFIFN